MTRIEFASKTIPDELVTRWRDANNVHGQSFCQWRHLATFVSRSGSVFRNQ